jgi:hypothetical protein
LISINAEPRQFWLQVTLPGAEESGPVALQHCWK